MPPKDKYTVKFSTGIKVVVSAGNNEEAMILAKADQINAGNRWKACAVISQQIYHNGEWVFAD